MQNNIAQPAPFSAGGAKSFAGVSGTSKLAASVVELRDSQVVQNAECLELDPSFNMRHSNSEGLPDLGESQNPAKLSAKEQDHYQFLNALQKDLKVDQAKLINLECRMSGKCLTKLWR